MGLLGKIFNKGKTDVKPVVQEEKTKPVSLAAPAVAAKKTTEKKVTAVATSKVEKRNDPTVLDWISLPLISEKATDLTSFNKYCFLVPVAANKSEVAKRIQNLYGVKPMSIDFVKKEGKRMRYGRRFGQRKNSKKAIITLAPTDKIELYEGV